MLTHGREPDAYCHLSVTGLWHGDPNFTVSSLARCIRDLEQMDDTRDHIGDLARTTSAVPLFTSLLDQAAFTASLGRQGATDSSFLPFTGNGNMGNGRDNVNFLMVGHTHEDVDALFSKVSAQTINKDVLTLPALMAEVWDSKAMHPVPLLLEEVADYKSYVDSFLGPLVGHSQPLGFRFSMANNVPIYKCQFKVDGPWTPDTGSTLWKQVDENHGTGFTFDQRQQEATRDGPEDGIIVVDELQQELNQENNLMLQPYVGDPANRPKRSFIPLEDITEGKFVILRPDDAFEAEIPRMIWLGRAMGAVVREIDDEHHGQFLVEWWRPKHRKSNATNKEKYLNVLVGLKDWEKDWEKDPGYFTPEWINATAAVYSWKYRSKGGVPQNARLNPLAKAAIESHFQQLDKENGVQA
ncbi:hypothetical protein R1sor_021778 [Riccia sorocarpa]|uniref:DUF7869 domain-containing protein n=1 Tax=Riccia sorocarpa TaxID=122646 RepID=A0ABD3GJX7_9MARC